MSNAVIAVMSYYLGLLCGVVMTLVLLKTK